MDLNKLKTDWENLTIEYVKIFCEKHEMYYEEDSWVGNKIGEIICIGDYYIDFSDIKYDIDNNIPEEKFDSWYWKSLEVYQITGKNYMSYESFCKGAPDIWTDEKLKKIKELQKRSEEAKEELEKYIEEAQN
jgi:hypothetical protein